jgi:hypothetical protein
MKIQSKLKREGGTVVELGDVTYHFKDNGEGAHVAEVTDKAHIEHLLAIKEGFFEHGKKPEKEPRLVEVVNDDKLPDDPETWTNYQCNSWAKAHKLNPLNKTVLLDYADKRGITGVEDRMNSANIIRIIAKGTGK